jgi:hypothetical protein
MMVLFPCDPLSTRSVESDFAAEYEAARQTGFETALLDFDALAREENVRRALRFVPEGATSFIYRGWMLKMEQYALLHEALAARGQVLVNTPSQYQLCHEIPEWVGLFEGLTPATRWIDKADVSESSLRALLRDFVSGPLIVKDFVKSRKHEWYEACFISDAADEDSALRVMNRFIELQAESLYGGVVLRRFVPLEQIGEHPRSKTPLGREWRVFVKAGAVSPIPYWGQNESEVPDLTVFGDAMSRISSNFWTMDLAHTKEDKWIVLELGDGQVSGLPEATNTEACYRFLAG